MSLEPANKYSSHVTLRSASITSYGDGLTAFEEWGRPHTYWGQLHIYWGAITQDSLSLIESNYITTEESSAVVRMSSVLMGLAYVSHILRPTSSHIVLVSHLPGYNNSACPSLELIAPKVHLWSMGNLVTTLHLCIYKHGQRLSFRPASLITTQSNAHGFIWNGSGGTKSVDWIITSKLRQAKLVANKLEPK